MVRAYSVTGCAHPIFGFIYGAMPPANDTIQMVIARKAAAGNTKESHRAG